MLTVKEILALNLGGLRKLEYDTGESKNVFGRVQKVGQRVENDFTAPEIADKKVIYAEFNNERKLSDYALCQEIIHLKLGEHYKYRSSDKNHDDKLCAVTKLKQRDGVYIIKKKYPQLDQAESVEFAQAEQEKFAHIPDVFEIVYL